MQGKLVVASCVLALVPFGASSRDIQAGKAKAGTCAACHGSEGVSVSDTIPNLAGQRAAYLENQLKALKDGSRKNPVMNAVASQLTPADMSNLAAYFASLPGGNLAAKASFLPELTKTGVTFPEGYREKFVKYHTINFPATRQVRHYYANDVAVRAAKAGRDLPDGSILFAEVYSAKLEGDKPVTGKDGFFEQDKLLFYTAMARDAGWGKDIPEMLRNEDWNYAAFNVDKKHRPANHAECFACHKPLDKASYTFTIKELAAAK